MNRIEKINMYANKQNDLNVLQKQIYTEIKHSQSDKIKHLSDRINALLNTAQECYKNNIMFDGVPFRKSSYVINDFMENPPVNLSDVDSDSQKIRVSISHDVNDSDILHFDLFTVADNNCLLTDGTYLMVEEYGNDDGDIDEKNDTSVHLYNTLLNGFDDFETKFNNAVDRAIDLDQLSERNLSNSPVADYIGLPHDIYADVKRPNVISDSSVDYLLRTGGITENSVECITTVLNARPTEEQLAAFLEEHYGVGGKGYIYRGKQISMWWDEHGIDFRYGTYAKDVPDRHLDWLSTARLINRMYEKGNYISRNLVPYAEKNCVPLFIEAVQSWIYNHMDLDAVPLFASQQATQDYLNLLLKTDEGKASLMTMLRHCNVFEDHTSDEYKKFIDVVFKASVLCSYADPVSQEIVVQRPHGAFMTNDVIDCCINHYCDCLSKTKTEELLNIVESQHTKNDLVDWFSGNGVTLVNSKVSNMSYEVTTNQWGMAIRAHSTYQADESFRFIMWDTVAERIMTVIQDGIVRNNLTNLELIDIELTAKMNLNQQGWNEFDKINTTGDNIINIDEWPEIYKVNDVKTFLSSSDGSSALLSVGISVPKKDLSTFNMKYTNSDPANLILIDNYPCISNIEHIYIDYIDDYLSEKANILMNQTTAYRSLANMYNSDEQIVVDKGIANEVMNILESSIHKTRDEIDKYCPYTSEVVVKSCNIKAATMTYDMSGLLKLEDVVDIDSLKSLDEGDNSHLL